MMTPTKKTNYSIASSPPRSTQQGSGRRKQRQRRGFEIENLVETTKHMAGVMTGINEVTKLADAGNDDASTVCTARLKAYSEEALRQKEEVEDLVKSTQYMAEIIRQLGVFPSEDEEPAAPLLKTPAESKAMNFDQYGEDTTPLMRNSKSSHVVSSPLCNSPQGSHSDESTQAASPPPSTHRQDLYAQLQTEKQDIEEKMLKMAMLFELQSPEEVDMCDLLNTMKVTSTKEKAVGKDVSPTGHVPLASPTPLSPLKNVCKTSSESDKQSHISFETPTKWMSRVETDTSRSEEEGEKVEEKIELVSSSISTETEERSHPSSVDHSHDSSAVSYSEDVLKQHHAVDSLVRSTEAMAEALRELEKAQNNCASSGGASSFASVEGAEEDGAATASASSQTESADDSMDPGYSEEALKQYHAVDDLIRNTESMAEALRELEQAQYGNNDNTSDDDDERSTSVESTLEQARKVTIDTNLERARTIFRRPKGARIVRRRRMDTRVIVITKIRRVIVSLLRRHRFLTPLLFALLITWFSSSQSEKATNAPLVQQMARDTCAKFTMYTTN